MTNPLEEFDEKYNCGGLEHKGRLVQTEVKDWITTHYLSRAEVKKTIEKYFDGLILIPNPPATMENLLAALNLQDV